MILWTHIKYLCLILQPIRISESGKNDQCDTDSYDAIEMLESAETVTTKERACDSLIMCIITTLSQVIKIL